MKATSLVKGCHAPWKNQGNFFCPSQEILTNLKSYKVCQVVLFDVFMVYSVAFCY